VRTCTSISWRGKKIAKRASGERKGGSERFLILSKGGRGQPYLYGGKREGDTDFPGKRKVAVRGTEGRPNHLLSLLGGKFFTDEGEEKSRSRPSRESIAFRGSSHYSKDLNVRSGENFLGTKYRKEPTSLRKEKGRDCLLSWRKKREQVAALMKGRKKGGGKKRFLLHTSEKKTMLRRGKKKRGSDFKKESQGKGGGGAILSKRRNPVAFGGKKKSKRRTLTRKEGDGS